MSARAFIGNPVAFRMARAAVFPHSPKAGARIEVFRVWPEQLPDLLFSFSEHDLRRIQIELSTSHFPPVTSELLMGEHNDITRCASGEIADDTRLEIHLRAHIVMLHVTS
jgi:hypothetical protein